jgi:hypothetical protein
MTVNLLKLSSALAVYLKFAEAESGAALRFGNAHFAARDGFAAVELLTNGRS